VRPSVTAFDPSDLNRDWFQISVKLHVQAIDRRIDVYLRFDGESISFYIRLALNFHLKRQFDG
jgi:extradiol dioxygenase family protein